MREIVFDTETTGLNAADDRIVEIGCVEIEDLMPTGKTFHVYINPTHPVQREAFKVHGLSNDFLKTKPVFKRVVNRFLKFIGDAPLVAHNANFDMAFINAELGRLDMEPLTNPIIDTLALAREKRPGSKHTLDALCRHYDIDISRRKKHGALLDAELLAEVYVELRGGRQMSMDVLVDTTAKVFQFPKARQRPTPLPSRVTDEDLKAHRAFVAEMGDAAIWNEYLEAKGRAA